jgi:transposase
MTLCYLFVCPRTIRRHLHQLGYRMVRPVLFVASPDPEYQAKIRKLVSLKRRAAEGKIILLYEDEVDLNLLPGVMSCWTQRGTQKKVCTPGQNVKRYGFGTVDYATGHIVFKTSEHKDSASFCELIQDVIRYYAEDGRRIVLVLDNYIIHSSQITQKALAPFKDRLSTFFLPTYSPNLNCIELLWKHLRRNVTHNHLFEGIQALVDAVGTFINRMNQNPQQVLSVTGASQ